MARSRIGEIVVEGAAELDHDDRRAAILRSDIAKTRHEMTHTVDAIEERLSPAHIKEQVTDIKEHLLSEFRDAKDRVRAEVQNEIQDAKGKVIDEVNHARTAVRDATVGKVEHMMERAADTARGAGHTALNAGSNVMDSVRANPIPIAMIGAGLAWLLIGNARGGARRRTIAEEPYAYVQDRNIDLEAPVVGEPRASHFEGERRVERAKEAVTHAVDRGKERVGGVVDRAQHRLGDARDSARDVAHRAGDRISNLADDARSRTQHAAHEARERTNRLMDSGKRNARRAETRVEDYMHDSPLAVGAICFAVGAAAGLLLPHTDKEDRLLGEAKQRIAKRLEGVAREALGHVEETAKQAFSPPSGGEQYTPQSQRRHGEWMAPNRRI
ncbi:MAG: DUF883 family protein [Polyangiaceae bacterium]|nr:DUF883 family protein [Polyangiaceae bacterium]